MQRSAVQDVLCMENILVYVVFSQHHDFINMLIRNSVANVRVHYAYYENIERRFDVLLKLIEAPNVAYSHKVVVFFFLLSIDRKMRHWLLQSQQTEEYAALQAAMLKRNVALAPQYVGSQVDTSKNPFLGQEVVFKPLDPSTAVSILTTIAEESFFEDVLIHNNFSMLEENYMKIKHIVLLS